MSSSPISTEPVAKPWYLSKTIISLIAGILLASLAQFGKQLGIDLPASITTDSLAQFLTVVIPMIVAIWARAVATHQLTINVDNAKAFNTSVIADPTIVTNKAANGVGPNVGA